MATRFIKRKTSRLYKTSSSNSIEQVLIFGEKVITSGTIINGRIKAKYRDKYEGFVRSDHLDNSSGLEIYFLDVGQADCAFVVTPESKKTLIDGGGNDQAEGFLSWKYQLANPNSDKLVIDLLVLSHADGDHLKGLIPILEHDKIEVKKIIHNGIGTFKGMDEKSGNLSDDEKYLVTYHSTPDQLDGLELTNTFQKWIDLIKRLNIPYNAVTHETGDLNLGDSEIQIEILGPIINRDQNNNPRLKWFKNHSHTINGHSVFFRLIYDEIRVMFSGDINIEGGEFVMKNANIASKLDSHVFKTPHHGSHEFYPPFLEAIRPQISVISSGDSPDHGHRRANFIGAIGLASRSKAPLVFSTEIAATFIDAKEIDLKSILPNDSIRDEDLKKAQIFKKKLHGMINVRSDGKNLYAMRRVNANYWWESYGPIKAEDYPSIF
jgi:competence protein ComEC